MLDNFHKLNEMWENTLEDHAEWLKHSKSLSLFELFQDVLRVQAQITVFEEKTKHMTEKNPLEEFSLLAAKYKNRWITNRFLVSVLEEFSLRFCETFADEIVRSKAAKKRMGDPRYKKVFEEYVNQEFTRYKKEYTTETFAE